MHSLSNFLNPKKYLSSLSKTPVKPPISKEDQVLSQTVLDLLSEFSANRLQHPYLPISKAESKKTETAILIFRQSSSWRVVQKMLNVAFTEDVEEVEAWVDNWTKIIGDFTRLKNSFIDSMEEYKLKDEELLVAKQTKNIEKIHDLKKKINVLGSKATHTRDTLKFTLIKIQEVLSNEDFPEAVKLNESCQEIINYVKKNWLELTVFAEWNEVKADDNKMNVRMQYINEPIEDLDLSIHQKNHTFKGIFLIKPADKREDLIPYVGEEPYRMTTFKKIQVEPIYLQSSHAEYLDKENKVEAYLIEQMQNISKKIETITEVAAQAINVELDNPSKGFLEQQFGT